MRSFIVLIPVSVVGYGAAADVRSKPPPPQANPPTTYDKLKQRNDGKQLSNQRTNDVVRVVLEKEKLGPPKIIQPPIRVGLGRYGKKAELVRAVALAIKAKSDRSFKGNEKTEVVARKGQNPCL